MTALPPRLGALLDRHIAAGQAARGEDSAERTGQLLALPPAQRAEALARSGSILSDADRARVMASLRILGRSLAPPAAVTDRASLPPALARLAPGEVLDIHALLRPRWWRHPALIEAGPRLLALFLVVVLILAGAVLFGVR